MLRIRARATFFQAGKRRRGRAADRPVPVRFYLGVSRLRPGKLGRGTCQESDAALPRRRLNPRTHAPEETAWNTSSKGRHAGSEVGGALSFYALIRRAFGIRDAAYDDERCSEQRGRRTRGAQGARGFFCAQLETGGRARTSCPTASTAGRRNGHFSFIAAGKRAAFVTRRRDAPPRATSRWAPGLSTDDAPPMGDGRHGPSRGRTSIEAVAAHDSRAA